MALLALGVFGASPALAQGGGDVGDVMMQVAPNVDDGEVEFTEENRIELPPAVPEDSEARENARFGLETANEARQLKEHAGDPQEIVNRARELGRDAAGAAPDLPEQAGSGQ